ncbi:flippase [Clostridium luticellarii]|uniref:Putative O-antigen transporter n=1 Tax=Clostridium luticellarii TaxID=1691940 RepID=A0A2T0BCC4_9CLOT|nr:flippase [Clostridium luticellarii]PRR81495.1 putative O-antigen transporter [Clostridium luticellarii]
MSVTKNYVYNVVYQIVILIVPLITVPYISRILGSGGVGINAYTNSIIQYFILFGTIGVSLYGNRTIAYVRDDKTKLSRTFWGIFLLKIITVVISYAVFIIFINYTNSKYRVIFLFQSIYMISAAIDVSWLFMGLEDFKKTVTRNLIVKVIGVVCIFLFVKIRSDLWKYVLILGCSELFGQLTLWLYVPKTIDRVKLSFYDIKKHFIPSINLFIPQIATQIYLVLNKTMLGALSNTNEVGYFDMSDKITKMSLAVVTSMGVVMLPRVANTFSKGDMKKVKKYLSKSFDFASYLSVPMMFGLAGISAQFTPWFFGAGFNKTGTLICVISPIVVFIAWSNVLGVQYMMPVGKVKQFTVSVTIGAVVNFIFNVLLIRHFQSLGTALATVIAEISVTTVQFYLLRKDIEFRQMFKNIWKYLISSIVMFVIVKFIGYTLGIGFKTTIFQIIIGGLVYIILLCLFKSDMNRKLIYTVFKKFKVNNIINFGK